MSWHDPQGPWARGMRRRRWSVLAMFGTAVAMAALGLGVALDQKYRAPSLSRAPGRGTLSHAWVGLPMLLAAGALAGMASWSHRRERRVARLVPAHDGLVCPKCVAVIPAAECPARCPRCRRAYTVAELCVYWEQYALAAGSVSRSTHARQAGVPTALDARRRTALARAGFLLVPVAFVLIPLIWLRLSVLGSLRHNASLILMFLGLGGGFALCMRYRRRTGDSKHCAACDYQQAPTGGNPPHCPECGAEWSAPGGVVHGRRTGQPWMLGCGVALVLVGAAAGLVPLTQHKFDPLLGLMPTNALISDIVNSRSFTREQWTELKSRTLTPTQELRLAEGLLDRRVRTGHLSGDDHTWLEQALAAGRLPESIRQRYYDEMFVAWLDAPSQVRRGQPFHVALGSDARNADSPLGAEALVFFSGFFIGDDATPQARRVQPGLASLLDTTPFGMQPEEAARLPEERRQPAHPEYIPLAQLAAQHAGPLRVRMLLWFVVAPAGTQSLRIQWQDDLTPVMPPNVVYSRRIELERVIEVVP